MAGVAMTNINELAQRMKAAADNVSEKEWDFIDTSDLTLPGIGAVNIGGKRAIFCLNRPVGGVNKSRAIMQHVAACCPENILSLVEALEKAQAITAAAEKLVRCKGRYHSEQNYRALAALFNVTVPELPPLESESRTVTVKLPKRYSCEGYHIDEAYLQEDPEGDCYDRDEVLEALAAAGIQVIEGDA